MKLGFIEEAGFLLNDWCKRKPVVLRNVISTDDLRLLNFSNLKDKISSGVAVDFFFHNHTDLGKPNRIRVPNGNLTMSFMDKFNRSEQSFITYLFNFHNHHPQYKRLADALELGYEFRYYSNLISISNKNSIIPVHIDFIDSFLFQIEGTRAWKVWDNTKLDINDLISVNEGKSAPPDKIMKNDLLFDVILNPGDLLFLPALYGHQGETHNKFSMSYSQGWTTYSCYRLLKAIAPLQLETPNIAPLLTDLDTYLPIPENFPGANHVQHYFDELQTLLSKHGISVPTATLNSIFDLDFSTLYKLPK